MTSFAVDAAVDALARRQHGAFSRAQAIRAGATGRMIDTRVARGRWLRLGPAVYALPSHPGTWHRAVMAAVLGERDAAAGGRTASVLHNVTGFRPGRPELVVPAHGQVRSRLAVVHRWADHRTTMVDHIPVLTLCDTLFSIAASVEPASLEAAVDDLLVTGRLSIDQLQRRHLELMPTRRPGLPRMRAIIDDRSVDGYEPPQSVLEEALYRILDRPGMPRYRRQAPLPWDPARRADAALVDVPVLIEADGRRWHSRRADFDRDRLRDRLAARHGHATLRFTARELVGTPAWVAAEICAVAALPCNDPPDGWRSAR